MYPSRLYEKLEYLKVRSIGCSSPSFDPKFGGRGVSNIYSIDYWLEKIDACEWQIKKRECDIYKLKTLIDTFNPIERDLFEKNISKMKTLRKFVGLVIFLEASITRLSIN